MHPVPMPNVEHSALSMGGGDLRRTTNKKRGSRAHLEMSTTTPGAGRRSQLLQESAKVIPTRTAVTPNRNISFGEVTVRNFDRTLGDHPDCEVGPPVTLDWTYEEDEPRDIDAFEIERRVKRMPSCKYLSISAARREKLLLRQGFSREELQHAETLCETTREQRMKTVVNLKYMRAAYTLEVIKRAISAPRRAKKIKKSNE
jgi:hypothetical protein